LEQRLKLLASEPTKLPMTTLSESTASAGWWLNAFADSVPGVSEAVLVSPEGMLITASSGLDQDGAAQFAAMAAALVSLSSGMAGRFCGGAVVELNVVMEHATVLVTSLTGCSLLLAAIADSGADAELIAAEMALVVEQIGGESAR
jgi:hypothetical protein